MVPVGISISYLSNGGANSSSGPVREDRSLRVSAGASPAADSIPGSSETYSCGLREPPGPRLIDLRQVALAQAQVLGRHLEQLVLGEEVQRLLEALPTRRGQPDRDVRGGRPDVRLLLLPADVDPDVSGPLLDADDHPFVDLLARLDEGRAPLLGAGQTEGQGLAGGRRGQRAVALLAKLAQEGPVSHSDRPHQAVARGEGQEGVAKPDQAPGRDHVLEPDP